MKNLISLRTLAVGASLVSVVGTASAVSTLDPSYAAGTFTSQYQQVTVPDPTGYNLSAPYSQWDEGTYSLTSNPFLEHDLWNSFTAPNGGTVLSVNGAVNPATDPTEIPSVPYLAAVWSTTIGAGIFNFNTLVANNIDVNDPTLELLVNGSQVGSTFSPIGAGTWETWSTSFSTTGGTLSIVDLSTYASGNDFSLASVPDGGMTFGLLGCAFLGLQAIRRKLSL